MLKTVRLFNPIKSDISLSVHNCDSDDKEKTLAVLRNLFGDTEVLPITTYNTLKLKSLVKSISKLYGIPFQDVNNVTMSIDDEAAKAILADAGGDQKLVKINFENVMKHSKTFRNFVGTFPEVGRHIEVLYGQIKSIGRHAGGVAITACAEEAMPVIRIRGEDQTPWIEGLTAKQLEPAGVIKYDFLVIQTLSYIRRCIELLLKKQNGGKDVSFDEVNEFYTKNLHPDSVGDGEMDVFESVYRAGKFPGIFQFTQGGAQKICVDAMPSTVMDLAVITSVCRPGPLASGVDKKYVDTVHNPENISFDHPILKEVLSETNGFVIFQENFMLLANKLAGFSLEESNTLRKLLVRPVVSLGEEMKKKRVEAGEKFVKGCVDKGLDINRANYLWKEEILPFVSYAFNKSHALAYSYVSYQCLHGQTRIFDWDKKEYTTIAKAYKRGDAKNIACYDESAKRTVSGEIDCIVRTTGAKNTNLKMCYKLKSLSGRVLRCSEDHKILTPDGFLELKKLKVGDKIAIEKQVLSLPHDKRCEIQRSNKDKISKGLIRHWKSVSPSEKTRRMMPLMQKSRELHEESREKAKRWWTNLHPDDKRKRIQKMQLAAMGLNGFKNRFVGIANCGHKVYSSNELSVCNWFHENGLEHETQIPMNTFGFCDFKCQGVYIEFDGMNRKSEYFEKKFKDEPYLVLKNKKAIGRDLSFLLESEKILSGEEVVFEKILSIEKEKETVMYDITMKSDHKNFLANNFVVHNCAWLYRNYPDEWVCAYLENSDDRDKAISDVESVGYTVGKPSALYSSDSWTVKDKIMVPSLRSIKGFGDKAVKEFIETRESWKMPDSEEVSSQFFGDIFDSFFYDYREVQLKKSVKIKKFWKFSKFNKRALESLIKTEAFDSLGIIGPGTLFENHAHMHRCLIDNWSKKSTIKFNIVKIAEETDSRDWADSDKIDFQYEILGTFDKGLMFKDGEITLMESYGIMPLECVNEIAKPTWFILDEFKKAKTAKGKEYHKLFISDITGKKRTLNYFFKIKAPLKRKGVYGAELYENGPWLNLAKGSYLTRIK